MVSSATGRARTQTQGNNARNRLLKASARLFIKHGYERTTMRNIATATGISLGSIAYYFKTKEDILFESMRVLIESGEAKALKVVSETQATRERLEALIELELDSFLNDTGAIVIKEWRALPKKRRKALLEHRQVYEDVWLSVLEQCQREGLVRCDPEIARRVLHGAFAWSETWVSTSGELSLDDLVEEVMNLITQRSSAAA